MKTIKLLLTIIAVLLCSVMANAHDFEVDGIYYNYLDGNNVEVTYRGTNVHYHNGYSGSITIPETITYNGRTYAIRSIGNSAFQDCSGLTSVTIPNSLMSIRYYAFYGCSSLTTITLPNSVTSIEERAFSNCTSLPSITIPNSVTSIGINAFYHCRFLKKDFINNSPLDAEKNNYWGALIGDSEIDGLIITGTTVVWGRKHLTTVSIPDYITTIGQAAFSECSSLTSVSIPNSVTSIGSDAFSGCTALTTTYYIGDIADWCGIKFYSSFSNPICYSKTFYINNQEIKKDLVIPNTVDSIGDYAFYRYSSLITVTLPNSVTNIGDFAFCDCSSLTTITLPNSVRSIGRCAFANCSSLTSINIPESVIHVGSAAFSDSGIYNNESNWDNNELYIDNCLISLKEHFTISGEYKIKEGVRLIAGQVFQNQRDLTTIVIPKSVVSISHRAFKNTGLTSVVIPDNVINMGEEALRGCMKLSSVSIGKGITYIEENLFASCSNLTSINISKGVKEIGRHAFYGCTSLESILLSSNIPPAINTDAFLNASKPVCYIPCGTLTDYQVSDWNNYSDAFIELCDSKMKIFYTSSDGEIVTPYNLDVFGARILDNTYEDGQGVITFQTPITQIGYLAFKNCSSLTSITIPNSVTNIDEDVFYNCTSLTSITIPNSVTSIGEYAFSNCTSLTSIKLPNSLTSIENETFSNCSSLTEIVIPNSVKSIGYAAFKDCIRLGKVHIGSNMETITENAFLGCKRLYDIYCYATYPPFADESSFANYNVYVYVPCEYQRDYILDVVWGKFKFIECIDSKDVTTDGVVITPTTEDVTIVWPTETGADTYTIVIQKGNKVFCTLIFNANGQLLNIVFAPARDGNHHPVQYAEQATNGYRFTVTGLDEGTKYQYTIAAKDASNNTIKKHTGEFITETTTAVENISTSTANTEKLLRDGQLLIIRDGKSYNAQGTMMNTAK